MVTLNPVHCRRRRRRLCVPGHTPVKHKSRLSGHNLTATHIPVNVPDLNSLKAAQVMLKTIDEHALL